MAIRPATPGTILVLASAVLLALVTVSTPVIKSIYFLEAKIGGSGSEAGAQATFGTLGYCIGNQCSSAKLGYEFNPNELLGIKIVSGNISGAVIKGLTYSLVLHPIALGFAALAFVTGILAHCRELSLTCLTSCFSGIGAVFALIAFGLDLALFVIAKKRIDSVSGASAQLGMAIWMTLASWILLIMAGCAFGCGICTRRRRNRVKEDHSPTYGGGPKDTYGEQMRMEALDAEADRKRRQAEYDSSAVGRGGDLPKFAEYEAEHEVPLTGDYEDGAYTGVTYEAGHNYGDANLSAAGAYRRPSRDGSYVQGVGPGYGRRQPTNDNSATNIAGYGAHAGHGRGPTLAADNAVYLPGVGPQPYHDGLETGSSVSGHVPRGYAPSAFSHGGGGGYTDPYRNDAAPVTMPAPRRQPTSELGHPYDYSGATFGGAGASGAHRQQSTTASHSTRGQYPSYDHGAGANYAAYNVGAGGSAIPVRAPSESGASRVRGPRELAPLAMGGLGGPGAGAGPISPEIPYASPTSTGAHGQALGLTTHVNNNNSSRRQPTVDANDGFGLVSAAAAPQLPAKGPTHSHAYSNSNARSYDQWADGRDGQPQQHPDTSMTSDQGGPAPPGYASAVGGSSSGHGHGYGHAQHPSFSQTQQSQYPREKA